MPPLIRLAVVAVATPTAAAAAVAAAASAVGRLACGLAGGHRTHTLMRVCVRPANQGCQTRVRSRVI